jgi:hypothetical protein
MKLLGITSVDFDITEQQIFCILEKMWEYSVLSYFATDSQSVSQSVLSLSPSVTPSQILAVVRQLQDRCHGASSLMGGRVCLLYLTLVWSLLHLIPWSLLCLTLYWESTSLIYFEKAYVSVIKEVL